MATCKQVFEQRTILPEVLNRKSPKHPNWELCLESVTPADDKFQVVSRALSAHCFPWENNWPDTGLVRSITTRWPLTIRSCWRLEVARELKDCANRSSWPFMLPHRSYVWPRSFGFPPKDERHDGKGAGTRITCSRAISWGHARGRDFA